VAIGDLSDRSAVLSAMDEHDRIGREAFLDAHGFKEATRYLVQNDGREYDSKAIAGVAHGYQFGSPLRPDEFSGGRPVTDRLRALGFDVRDIGAAPKDRVFGAISGVGVGTTFASRVELAAAGVHRPTQAGISYSSSEGADSIVVSGGYEDDEDFGSVIVYTGHGGNEGGRQIADQELERGNIALARNCDEGLPVRVVRGAGGDPEHSPIAGYRYDGLYAVERYWRDRGRAGFLVWRYRLVQVADPVNAGESQAPEGRRPQRATSTVQRLVRNTAVATWVKAQHDHRCQVCGLQLVTPAGPYAEGAHVRPLGRPHDGPDSADNLLCLCPNHHVLLDSGALYVDADLRVVDASSGTVIAELRTASGHTLAPAHLGYQRDDALRRYS
jgi:putative restriction endonuclease